jgi:type I restriction enzyme S subunit
VNDLPAGWIYCAISDLGDLRLGKMLDRAKNRGLPANYLRNTNVRWFRFDLEDLNTIAVSPHEMRLLSIEDGDLLICEGGEPGRCAVWDSGKNDLVFQKALHRFRGGGAILPKLLMYRMRLDAETGALARAFTGTTIKHLTRESLARYEVPVPPAPEQRRIVERLDSLLGRIDACRERIERLTEILKRFRESILTAAIRGKLTHEWRIRYGEVATEGSGESALASHEGEREPRAGRSRATSPKVEEVSALERDKELLDFELPPSWTLVRGRDVVEAGADIVYGIVQPGPKLRFGVPYIRGLDIERGRILVSQLQMTSSEIAKRYARASIRAGDVLLGIIRATKVAIVPQGLDGANITQGTARFRPSRAIRSRYLAIVLESPPIQKWLHAHYRGIDMPGLNLADVRRVPIPLPPLEEQDDIIRQVDVVFDLLERLEARTVVARAKLDSLTPATLGKAFRGDLISQSRPKRAGNVHTESQFNDAETTERGRPRAGQFVLSK